MCCHAMFHIDGSKNVLILLSFKFYDDKSFMYKYGILPSPTSEHNFLPPEIKNTLHILCNMGRYAANKARNCSKTAMLQLVSW